MEIPLVDLKANYFSIKEEIDKAISEVIETSSFIQGPQLREFEKNFASYCNSKHCIGTSSGTSALILSLKAHGIKQGDEVITTPYTFVATTGSIIEAGAKIKFVDVSNDYLIDASKIKEAITDKTKAIMPVHLYGQHADMDAIKEIAEENNLLIIEDAAQAHGAEYKNKKSPVSTTATFSFYPAKNLGAYGDAGCVVTNDDEIAEKVRMLLDRGRTSKYEYKLLGSNNRLDTIQAAILNAKLKHLDKWVEQRRKNAQTYNQLLSETNNIILPTESKNRKHAYHLYVIRAKEREKLQQHLKKSGIQTGIHYPISLHLQEAYSYLGHKQGDFPVSEAHTKEILSLPLYPELTEEQISYITEKIKEFYSKN